jgi:DNA-binding transcriptional MerR regulator
VDDDELMTIGNFAPLSGLSTHALRHYDEVGLLRPRQVDDESGYRRYRRSQVQAARLIQALRNLGLPIEEVRRIVADPEGDHVKSALAHHRERLKRERSHLDVRIRDVDRYLQEGITMPVVQAGCRPVQIKIAVEDSASSFAFYQEAFWLNYEVARRTDHDERSAFVFGEYGQDNFFLLWLLDDPSRFDPPGTANFSFLVEDVDKGPRTCPRCRSDRSRRTPEPLGHPPQLTY